MTTKWIVWSLDERSGRWLQVNEGLKKDAQQYADRANASAAKYGVTGRYVACPEGSDPA